MELLAYDQFGVLLFLFQGYGAQSAEEKQRLFKLMRHLNLNGEYGSEPYTPTAQNSGGVSEEQALYESLILLA